MLINKSRKQNTLFNAGFIALLIFLSRLFLTNVRTKGCYLLLLFPFLNLSAQEFSFRNFTTNEGLSTNKVISIYQKPNKQLWLGTTEGINIYDGNSFQSGNQYFKLPNRTVYNINEIDGNTYVATNGGLCVYNGVDTSVFTTNKGLKHNRVYKTLKDKDGVIWIATQRGVHILKNNKITNVDIHRVVNDSAIYNIYEDNIGALWFCSLSSGVIKFHNGEAQQFLNIDYPHSFVGSIFQVGPNKHWAGTRSGLYEINKDTTIKLDIVVPENTSFYDIKKVSNGDIWIGTNAGVIVYRNNKFTRYTTDNGLINNTIFKIFEDSEKCIWFTSPEKGISQLINEKFALFEPSDIGIPNVTSIVQKNDSSVYLGSKNGVVLFNLYTNKIDSVASVKDVEYYNGFYEKERNLLIIGTNNGTLVIENDSSYSVINPVSAEGNLRKCWTIVKDKNEKLWFGTSAGVGHLRDSLISFFKSEENYHDFVLDIELKSDGTLYFATELGLSYLRNGKLYNYSKEHNFHRARIRQLTTGPNGNLWFAGENGLYKQKGDKFEKIDYHHIRNEPLHSLTFDNQGNLWAGASNGVLKFNFSKEEPNIRYLSKNEGFLGKECNISAIYAHSDGKVLFGTDNGMVIYRPAYNRDQSISPKAILQVEVNGIDNLEEYSDSLNNDGLPVNLLLPKNSNDVSFSFKVISLLLGKDVQFQYKLEGLENQWKSSKNDYKVEYSELNHGDYVFHLKIEDHPELEKVGDIKIPFSIKKPFYVEWWFILICLSVVITWIYSYYLIRKNVKLLHEQQHIILSQKSIVEEKNREVFDSITYAKRIQDAILPNPLLLDEVFKDHFVYYKPRDIVSGDFYWVEKIDNKVVFAAADCTGHGVPGAMVSLMCSNLLRKVILEDNILKPGTVLDNVSQLLLERLETNQEKVTDGMDISLCVWDTTTNKMEFSGAYNPLYLMRNNEMIIIKADKQPIGYYEDRVPFTTHEVPLQEGDQIVLFSDGYKDQFGGPKDKKFSTKRFKNNLLQNSHNSLIYQFDHLDKELKSWQGDQEQVDDICVFSVKF